MKSFYEIQYDKLAKSFIIPRCIEESRILKLFTIVVPKTLYVVEPYKYFPCVKYQLRNSKMIERIVDASEICPIFYKLCDGWNLQNYITNLEKDALKILKWSKFNNKNNLILNINPTLNWNDDNSDRLKPIIEIAIMNIGNF